MKYTPIKTYSNFPQSPYPTGTAQSKNPVCVLLEAHFKIFSSNSIFRSGLLTILLLFITSCQLTPTKVYESHEVFVDPLVAGAKKPLKLGDDVVVVDAREAFEYTLSHLPGAFRLDWLEFTNTKGAISGQLKSNLSTEARHLARLGIGPDTKVIVVGRGLSGKGEEGRVAWTLLNLGVRDVQVANANYFHKVRRTNKASMVKKSHPMWEPERVSSLEALQKEIRQAINEKFSAPQKIHFIDVRSKKEYFNKPASGSVFSDLQAINIPWNEFFTKEGRPNLKLKAKLKGIGIKTDDRVYLLSNKGLRSAASTVAMLSMGYKKAANYSGGLQELIQDY